MRTALLLILIFLVKTESPAQRTVGMINHTQASEDGYVLFAPMYSHTTYLIDKCGKQLHHWTSNFNPANSVYLLPDGKLLRTGDAANPLFPNGGVIEMLDWNSNSLWNYFYSGNKESQHHDVCPLPNGNVLALVWEVKQRPDAIAEGRDSTQLGATLWTEKVVELQPDGPTGAKVIWEWSAWDHLVQDRDPAGQNYGSVSGHPERIDVNFKGAAATNPDWLHANGLAYNEALDQIMISVYWTNELWVIDHSTTTAEAATDRGGLRGKGGDLLYRWGNPQAYGRGQAADQKLFRLHNAHWIGAGMPDAGKIIVFNNGQGRPGGEYSSVNIIDPPVDASGNYPLPGSAAYGPQQFSWEYHAPKAADFYAPILSGAEKLPNGNTLICEASKGNFFEVDSAGTVVWKYINPVSGLIGIFAQGETPQQNMAFRSVPYPPDYTGFSGQQLVPGAPIERNSPASYDCFPAVPASVGGHPAVTAAFTAGNPFSGSITLSRERGNGPVQATLTNYKGAICGSWDIMLAGGQRTSLEVSPALAPGIYMLQISEGGRLSSLKLRRN